MSSPIPFEQTAEQSAAPEISKAELRTKGRALHHMREVWLALSMRDPRPVNN